LRAVIGIDTLPHSSHNWENPSRRDNALIARQIPVFRHEDRKIGDHPTPNRFQTLLATETHVTSRKVLTILVTAACVFPVAIAILLAVARLLGAMQDVAAAAVLDRVALAIGILWAIDLVCLLVAQGINSLGPPWEPPGGDS
jgi:hypothetical protein